MKAIVTTQYGSPDVLQLADVEKPTPKDNEVLIKLHAAVVGPSDCAFRKGHPFMIKLMYGLKRPKYNVLGVELAGEIEAVGKDVTLFQQGDQVFGISPNTLGAHAEYKALPENVTLAKKSAQMSFQDAVAVADGGLTALTFLRDIAKVQSGQKVLINGASGAVGAYAVQVAKYYGAEVTGVCSTTNLEMVTALGADHVIDYTQTDFTHNGQTYNVIFDTVGKRTFSQCRDSLTSNGIYLSTSPDLGLILSMLATWFSSKKAKFVPAGLMQKKENLTFLNELFEAGKLRAVIDRRYPLEQVPDAHRYVETGRKRGNVVITFGSQN